MKLLLSGFIEREKSGARPKGYVKMCTDIGRLSEDGRFIEFTQEQWEAIRKQSIEWQSKTGLGDLIHRLAGPIGQLLHRPCLERDADGKVTQNLEVNSPCANREKELNKIRI